MYIFAKAQENLKAAELLIANAMYASSIHCSYYASLQLSKRKLMESLAGFLMTSKTKKLKNSKPTLIILLFSQQKIALQILLNTDI